MEFSETRIKQEVEKNGIYKAVFTHVGNKQIKRINPLCKCIKFKINLPEITFWYKVNQTSNKIVVITYDDNTTDFLELQSFVK